MKIMLYSQHVLGIGHFFRSMEVAKALHEHEVLFVEGGDPLPGFVPPRHVKRFILPPIMMDADFKTLEIHEGTLEEIKTGRKQMLMDAFTEFSPDVLVTELFPFGRKQFRFELIPLLDKIHEQRPSTRVVCSLRDILVEKKDQAAYEKGVLDILNRYFDLLLVHSDPELIPLEESFERIGEIKIPIFYTGFIVRDAPVQVEAHRGKIIVVSSGGGRVGIELLSSAIKAVQMLADEDLHLRVFVGPFMEASDRKNLTDLAAGDADIQLLPFSLDFLSELAHADLSISMAGYNTCMDILSTGVRALVYPFPQNREQALRAQKLEKLGQLKVIPSLAVQPLAQCILSELRAKYSTRRGRLNLSGKTNTAVFIDRYCRNQS
ncbi:MAG: glycosyltransferase [Deltaproteobacteria bacterium]|uniref:Glycosyl transferase family 28 C-terminal domain-containing protein n=2 Tax=Desulforhabdus amnigena TaxID=40218 RepID=A0A9W6D0M1_9BACT|nr:glycosyltransferase [Deltaproteobacteria bacterium]GLI33690.1 hypothetical protein DAMNIGENAA_11230 [Desulforhabdus amnigena]